MEPFITKIQYYNVSFYLLITSELDAYKYSCLANRIRGGAMMKMKDLYQWCKVQNITYKTKFHYRKDFPFTANVWNLYSYIRAKIELKV